MSYAYFTGRGRRGRDLGRAHIRKLVADSSAMKTCQVWLPPETGLRVGQPCGCPAVAATLDGRHVCAKHLP